MYAPYNGYPELQTPSKSKISCRGHDGCGIIIIIVRRCTK